MRIRPFAAALAASFALAFAASAAPVWTAPGWYQIADTIVGPFVWKGPFVTKEECEVTLPENEEDADYMCDYLSERPSWDD
ncbi:MAG: hypothetical protein SGI91_21175 [Alphaproteobacteria bacterium]|jgi:hypothetical protein|nr:hypothetical protein [Alphaproteobacteria bacterium]